MGKAPSIAIPHTHRHGCETPPPLIRLVIFGDSWARCDGVHTWPELLGEHLGWPTINVALPGSDSATLELQFHLLRKVLERSGRELHPDSWALVHTGGNDVLRSGPNGIVRAVMRALCCCCACLPCCHGALGMLDGVASNRGPGVWRHAGVMLCVPSLVSINIEV